MSSILFIFALLFMAQSFASNACEQIFIEKSDKNEEVKFIINSIINTNMNKDAYSIHKLQRNLMLEETLPENRLSYLINLHSDGEPNAVIRIFDGSTKNQEISRLPMERTYPGLKINAHEKIELSGYSTQLAHLNSEKIYHQLAQYILENFSIHKDGQTTINPSLSIYRVEPSSHTEFYQSLGYEINQTLSSYINRKERVLSISAQKFYELYREL